ncbi:hypothetical protein SAMN05892883_4224 [Jatrophihabitans sp. GAS493]|uniref:hypothetical protein n=1 Tax=Jatrophihabitans sp. GAS493 TaxID=1907575 RepID=UPI000BB95937|nr:hypothetical protein [Jatrophihabitans sp. GAS493]SOD75024.1 hypothetical protein SAMN05892883_4224 [Jatrophihabitans sp. GAS493]
MVKSIGLDPRVHTDAAGTGVESHAGGVLLVEAAVRSGLSGDQTGPWSRRHPSRIGQNTAS